MGKSVSVFTKCTFKVQLGQSHAEIILLIRQFVTLLPLALYRYRVV